MSDLTVWCDGSLRDPDAPLVTADDHGLTVGDGAFETCGVVRGRAFALTRHVRRLERSAAGLGLPAPDEDLVRAGVAAVLAARPDAGRVRITMTAGRAPLGSQRAGSPPTVIVAAGPGAPAADAAVVRVPWVRNERSAVAGLKTTSYAENVVALAFARARGATEALLANTRGELCEGTASNVFVERGGKVLTPPLSSGCLAGITRELALEWGAAAGLPVCEEPLAYAVLDDVAAGRGGLAVSGSVVTLAPVVALDGAAVAPGEITLALRDVYRARALEDVDP